MIELSSQIYREIGSLSRMIQTISDNSYKEYNLQKGQFMFITRICENPGINHAQLTQMMRVDKGTTTKAVQKLVKLGYITKQHDTIDSRMIRLYSTESGDKLYKKLIEKEEDFISKSFKNFTKKERDLVLNLIIRMKENLDEEWREGKK